MNDFFTNLYEGIKNTAYEIKDIWDEKMERVKEDHRKMVLGAAKSMKELDEGKHPDSYYVDKAVSLAKKGKLFSYLVEELEKKQKNEFIIDHSSTIH